MFVTKCRILTRRKVTLRGNTMTKFFTSFLRDESGASAAEYALIIAIVGVGVGAAALALGANVQTAIGNASNEVYACNNDSSTAAVSDFTSVSCAP
jgi:pilus assembly protein Flp/PilA